MKKNEFIGFEALYDVHTELDTEHQVLIQVKHTVQKKANNDAANLTELDIDLWKTLNNWVSVISDKNDGRQDLDAQKHFVEKTFFVLASNKSFTSTNEFLRKLHQLQNNTISNKEFVTYLSDLAASTKSEDIKGYINKAVNLNVDILISFLMRIKTQGNRMSAH